MKAMIKEHPVPNPHKILIVLCFPHNVLCVLNHKVVLYPPAESPSHAKVTYRILYGPHHSRFSVTAYSAHEHPKLVCRIGQELRHLSYACPQFFALHKLPVPALHLRTIGGGQECYRLFGGNGQLKANCSIPQPK